MSSPFDALLRGPAIKIPENPAFTIAKANYASEFYKRLVSWINDFESSLDREHEVGIRLVSFGREVVFHLTDISYWNPSLIRFNGMLEDGSPVELIQHVSQISVLLTKLKRTRERIGFQVEPESEAPPAK